MYTLEIKKLQDEAIIPTRGHKTDAGLDLYSLYDCVIEPGEIVKCKTGIAVSPDFNSFRSPKLGYQETFSSYCSIRDKSSLGAKGVKVFGGVIDDEYTGEIIVLLGNMNTGFIVSCFNSALEQAYLNPGVGTKDFILYLKSSLKAETAKNRVVIQAGQKIAQLVMSNIELPILQEVTHFSRETARGEAGFGSTGA